MAREELKQRISPSLPDVRHFQAYSTRLQDTLNQADWNNIAQLCQTLRISWSEGRRVFLCGNGGSAGNALHIANDLVFGADPIAGVGMRAEALSANPSILTCIGNDIGYEHIYAHQLKIQAQKNDVLIVLSGSGNSPNIIQALHTAKQLHMHSFAILGYDGGACKALADVAIHFAVDDMQIAEDMQMIVGHMMVQALAQAR